jgi:NADH:ubiquinone oxidoreductase subunit
VYEAQQLQEASAVAPEWHVGLAAARHAGQPLTTPAFAHGGVQGWLHYSTDVVPTSANPNRTGPAIVKHSDAPNSHIVPEAVRDAEWRPNPTLVRERGYGLPTYYSAVGENGFYMQPGNPLSPLYKEQLSEKVANQYDPNQVPSESRMEAPVLTKFEKFARARAKMPDNA